MKRNKLKPSEVITDAIRRIRNLEKEARTKARRSGAAPLDTILNKILEHIGHIRTTASPLERWETLVELRETTLESAWKSYMNVQAYRGPEVSSYSGGFREIPLRGPADDVESAVVYSGGHLGFAHVKWGSSMLGTAVPVSKMKHSGRSAWWNPRGYYPRFVRDLQNSDYWVYNPRKHGLDNDNDEFWRKVPSHKPGGKT
tara:strand:- start:292 stop:891 length:600 start_codon:yes stop_codon:yes gene_type:complete